MKVRLGFTIFSIGEGHVTFGIIMRETVALGYCSDSSAHLLR